MGIILALAAAFTLAVENPLILNLLKDESEKTNGNPFRILWPDVDIPGPGRGLYSGGNQPF